MKPVVKLSSLAIAVSAAIISGCGAGTYTYGPYPHSATATPARIVATPTPTPVRTLAPGESPTPIPSATPLPTPTPTPLPSAVATFPTFPTATPTIAPTLAPGQTASPTPVPTIAPTLAPGATATPTPRATVTPVVTNSPSPAPTLAPGASPTPTPTPAALYHPATNGDQFAFAGTEIVTFSRPDNYPTPEPTTTADYAIAQTVTVKNPATFGTVSDAVDFSTSETDTETTGPSTSPIQDVIDNYYTFSGTEFTGDFYALGFTSVDSNNYAVVQSYASPGSLADILPEASGATWTNVATQQINTQNSAGDTSQQNYKADGTYSEELNFPSDGIGASGTPQPGPTSAINESLDGSGTYDAQRNGNARTGDTKYTFSAPSGGSIAIAVLTQPLTSASPGATPVATSTTSPDWIPSGYLGTNLYTETDVDNGSKTIPTACKVPAAFGTTANQIVQTKNRVDSVLGEFETYTFTYYDLLTVGPVCTVLHDVTTNYYDYTGQTYPGYFAGVPLQVTTIDEMLALTSEQLNNAARHPESRSALSRAFAMRSGTLASRVAVFQARRRLTITRNIHTKIQRHSRNANAQRGSTR